MQYFVDDGWRYHPFVVIGLDPLCLQGLVASLLILAASATAAVCADTVELRFRHAHHLFRDSIRFLFVCVAWGVNPQLWLKGRGCVSMDRYSAKVVAKAGQCSGRRLIFEFESLWQSLCGVVPDRALQLQDVAGLAALTGKGAGGPRRGRRFGFRSWFLLL